MSDLTLHEIDDATLTRLTELARVNNQTVEAIARELLESALHEQSRREWRVRTAERIAAMTPEGVTPTNSVILLREDRDR
jgi:predicted transcriptional regulator